MAEAQSTATAEEQPQVNGRAADREGAANIAVAHEVQNVLSPAGDAGIRFR